MNSREREKIPLYLRLVEVMINNPEHVWDWPTTVYSIRKGEKDTIRDVQYIIANKCVDIPRDARAKDVLD